MPSPLEIAGLRWHPIADGYIALHPFGNYKVIDDGAGGFMVLLNGDRVDRKHQRPATAQGGRTIAALDYRKRVMECFSV